MKTERASVAVVAGAGAAAVVRAVVVGVLVGGAGCRSAEPSAGAASPPRVVVARPRAPVRHEAPFTHPLLAGATTAVTRENCSRAALGAVVEQSQGIAAKFDPAGGRGGSKRAAGASPSPATAEKEQMVRGELLPRVDACVARDGPLDPQWDVAHAAVLSLGVCLDSGQPETDRAAQCRRARELLAGLAKVPRADR